MHRSIITTIACAACTTCAALIGCGPSESDASTAQRRPADGTMTPAGPAAARPSGRTVASLSHSERALLASRLQTLRSQIELYSVMLEKRPWSGVEAGDQPWSWLMEAGYGEAEAPANPLSPAGVASTVLVVTEPGATGATVDPADAGWVWNSADGALYVAGADL